MIEKIKKVWKDPVWSAVIVFIITSIFFYSFVYNLINIMCDFPFFFSRRETLDAVEFLIYRIKRYLSKL